MRCPRIPGSLGLVLAFFLLSPQLDANFCSAQEATPETESPKQAPRPRLAVLTDIGGDPDDQQSLIRLLVYANEFRIEALIATASGTPGELKESITRPDLIHKIVDAYGRDLPGLRQFANGWPTAEELKSRIVSGNPQRGTRHIGAGHDTAGSRTLIRLIDRGTPADPLHISIWGGQTDLAQALWRVKHERGLDGLSQFARRMRVFDIADQDKLAAYIADQFPGLHYVLSSAPPGSDRRSATFRGMYLTGDLSLTSREWINANVSQRGALGALYPLKTWTAPNPHSCLKEGDTPSFFFFLPRGGNDPADPTQPGWGGQYVQGEDNWYHDLPTEKGVDPRETISRWRSEFQQDFAQRMRWCQGAPSLGPPLKK